MLIADYLHVHHESHQNILYNSFKKKIKKNYELCLPATLEYNVCTGMWNIGSVILLL